MLQSCNYLSGQSLRSIILCSTCIAFTKRVNWWSLNFWIKYCLDSNSSLNFVAEHLKLKHPKHHNAIRIYDYYVVFSMLIVSKHITTVYTKNTAHDFLDKLSDYSQYLALKFKTCEKNNRPEVSSALIFR